MLYKLKYKKPYPGDNGKIAFTKQLVYEFTAEEDTDAIATVHKFIKDNPETIAGRKVPFVAISLKEYEGPREIFLEEEGE